MPQSHCTHPYRHLKGSLENCSSESRKIPEVFCLRENNFQLKCFYGTVRIPTQNSSSSSQNGKLHFSSLWKMKNWFLFTWKEDVTARTNIWQEKPVQGHHLHRTPGGFAGLCKDFPLPTGVQSNRSRCSTLTPEYTHLSSFKPAVPPCDILGYLSSSCFPLIPDRFDELSSYTEVGASFP